MERKGSRFGSEDACGAQVNGGNVPVTDALPVCSIVETIPCPALCLSTTGHVLELNPDAEAVLGLDRDNAIGKCYISEFLPKKTCEDFQEVLTGVLTGRQAKGYRNLIKRSDGTERVLIWNMNRLVSEDDNAISVLAIGQDITDTEQRERLTRVTRNLAVQLAGTDDLAEGLRLCVEAAIEISGMDCGAIYLIRRKTGVRELAYYKGLTSEFARKLSHYDSRSARTMSVMKGKASYIEGREIHDLPDIQAPRESLHAIAVLPVLCEGEVAGSLYIASHSIGHIPEWAKTALENIAAQIGNTIVRLQSREALRNSEAWLESILESSPAAILVIDPQGSILRCNQATVNIRELTSTKEMVGKSVFDFVSPEDIQRAREGLVRTLEIGSIDSVEYMLMDREGYRFPVVLSTSVIKDTFGNPTGVVIVVQDITERKLTESALRESEEKFRRMFELSPYASVYTDIEGNIILCNGQFTIMHATKDGPEHVAGRNVSEFIAKEERPRLFRSIKNKIEKDGAVDPIEYTMLREDGTRFPATAYSTLVKDHNGKPVGLVAIAQDITDRKESERALLEHQKRLKSLASKLALAEEQERRRLAAYVHDELGQRLAMMKLHLKSSFQSLPAGSCDSGINDVFRGIDELIDHVHSLTFELSSPLLYEIGLTAAIESWLDSEIQKKHGIRCRLITDAELGDLEPDLAVVLFRNTRELVTNAVKHSQADSIHVELRKPDGSIRVVVADDGIGLTSDRIKSAPDETGGFGLFSIREQIEYMGGTLEINSAPHQGTRIIMTVPLVDHSNSDTAPANERG